jgi:GNAT superfamily N-acetyltransferase
MVRRAAPEDAAAIVAVRRAAWLAAYSSFVTIAFARSEDEEAVAWRDAMADPDRAVWVAGDPAIGFASAQGCELVSLYVSPEAWGRGTGGALHDAALDHLRGRGCRAATLWVFEANARGRRFYEARGWRADPGVVETGDDDWPVPALGYRLELAGS